MNTITRQLKTMAPRVLAYLVTAFGASLSFGQDAQPNPSVGQNAKPDPPCAMDVYPKTSGERYFQVTVTRNRCGRPTRAIIKCGAPGGGSISRGNVVKKGVSKTLCSRNTLPGDRGWDVYYGGKWHARWF